MSNLSSWSDKKNSGEANGNRKRKRDLPPVRGSVKHVVQKEEEKEGEIVDNAKRTKPEPAAVVCERFKIEGNNYFKGKNFDLAVEAYSKAINALESNPIPWANRAMARLKLKQFKLAERDCSKCLELDPNYVKALYRRGQARQGSKKWALASEDFQQILKQSGKNDNSAKNAKVQLEFCQKQLRKTEKGAAKSKKKNSKKKKIMIEVVDDEKSGTLPKAKIKIEKKQAKTATSKTAKKTKPAFIQKVEHRNLQKKDPSKSAPAKKSAKSAPAGKAAKSENVSSAKAKPRIEVVKESKEKVEPRESARFVPKVTPKKRKKEMNQESPVSPYQRKSGEALPIPASYFDLQRLWRSLTFEDRTELFLSLAPENFPKLFGQSLSTSFLEEIFLIYSQNVEKNSGKVLDGLKNITKVARFELVNMFANKENLKNVFEKLKNIEDVEQVQKLFE